MPNATPLAAPESRLRAWRRGRRAEWIAAWALRLRGYRVLAHGFCCAAGEIDLIVRRGDVVVFVEVKARDDLGLAVGSISQRQRARISRAAALFMAGRGELPARLPLRRGLGHAVALAAPLAGCVAPG